MEFSLNWPEPQEIHGIRQEVQAGPNAAILFIFF